MTEIVLPEDSNSRGSIFGGRVLALIDKCAAIVALRHTRGAVTTIGMDSVEFHNPVRVGDILNLCGWINAVFGSSMEIEVEVYAEHPNSGERKLTTTAYVTMVALGDDDRPRKAPKLALRTDSQKRRAAEANERRKRRLASRSSS